MSEDRYTQHPRATLWLLQEGELTVGDGREDRAPAFAAEVAPHGLPGMLIRGYRAYRRLRGTTLGDLLAAPAS